MNLETRGTFIETGLNYHSSNYTSQLYSLTMINILKATFPHKLIIENSPQSWHMLNAIYYHGTSNAVKDLKELFENSERIVYNNYRITGATGLRSRTIVTGKGLMIVDGEPLMAVTIDRALPQTAENMRIHINKKIKGYPVLYKMMFSILESFPGEVSIRESIRDICHAELQLPEKASIAKLKEYKEGLVVDCFTELHKELIDAVQ